VPRRHARGPAGGGIVLVSCDTCGNGRVASVAAMNPFDDPDGTFVVLVNDE
jgi:hypothetical protein